MTAEHRLCSYCFRLSVLVSGGLFAASKINIPLLKCLRFCYIVSIRVKKKYLHFNRGIRRLTSAVRFKRRHKKSVSADLAKRKAALAALSPEQKKALVAKLKQKRMSWTQYLRLSFKYARLAYKTFVRKHRLLSRIIAVVTVIVLVLTLFFAIYEPKNVELTYQMGPREQSLLSDPIEQYAQKISLDKKTGTYSYNSDYTPTIGEVSGQSSSPKITAKFAAAPDNKITVDDPVNKVGLTLKPLFGLYPPKQQDNRVMYPLRNYDAIKVYTLKGSGVKEDIILRTEPSKNDLSFVYEMSLPDGLEARIEADGSLGVYGVASTLLGNVTTSTEQDAELLKKARENGEKKNLIFRVPAPVVLEEHRVLSKKVTANFALEGSRLTLHVTGLKGAKYPLSVDPTIYVETAQKLMRGNNETNTDFDIDDELIQKSQTTGARINEWSSTNSLTNAVWGQGTAVAGGYIYSAGGATGTTTVTNTYYTAGSTSWTVPAGVTSVTIKTWGGGGGGGAGNGGTGSGGAGGGGGYAKIVSTVTAGDALNISVGSGGTRGNGTGLGGDGGGLSSVTNTTTATLLVKAGGGAGGGGSRGSGTGGAGGAGGGSSGVIGSNGTGGTPGGRGSPGTTTTGGAGGSAGVNGSAGAAGVANAGGNAASSSSANCTTAGSGSGGAGGTGGGGNAGIRTTNCANGGGGGAGRFGGGGGGSSGSTNRGGGGGGGGSSYVDPAGTAPVQTAGSGTTPGNNTDVDRGTAATGGTGSNNNANTTNGADGAVVITYTTGTVAVSNTVSWAKFDSTTRAIESPNPGNGVCTGWCTQSAYNLPTALTGLSLVAYNGFLYAIGGSTSAGTPQTTVYIAKLGANGEPQLWHPNGGTPVYWYTDTALSNARSYFAAVATNNRLFILGGLTTSTTLLSTNTVQSANINPNGTLTAWSATGMTALTSNRYGLSAQLYNNTLYVLGGSTTFTGTPITTVEYAHINSDGTMNSWVTAKSMLGSGRMSIGGSFTAVSGAYIYASSGCSAVNASGYCTAIIDDIQLASINADGSIDNWKEIDGLNNSRIGYTLISWQGGLYRLGGCRAQSATTGECTNTIFDVDYGVINPAGEVSTVNISTAPGSGTCTGSTPVDCDLPSLGTGWGESGHMLSNSVILNGYLYVIGGCTDFACSDTSTNTAYVSIGSDGSLQKPATCPAGQFSGPTQNGAWCVDNTNVIGVSTYSTGTAGTGGASSTTITGAGTTWTATYVGRHIVFANGQRAEISARASNTSITVDRAVTVPAGTTYNIYSGVAASGLATFNSRIYVIGGLNGTANTTNIYYNSVNADGSLGGAWTATDMTTAGIANDVAYTYSFARANPTSAGSSPGNLFVFGGCTVTDEAGCSGYTENVYKCNISTTGAVSGCSTSGQLAIGTVLGAGNPGLAIHSGTIYANYVYLIGGVGNGDDGAADTNGDGNATNDYLDLDEIRYARIDNSNNIVAVSGGAWVEVADALAIGRRRGWAFGYNGHIYAVGGYDATGGGVGGVIPFIEWAKINVSNGQNEAFQTSSVTINQRWGLSMAVSNSYAYVIGGCDVGASPGSCSSFEPSVQTFQLYNNNSGSVADFTAQADQTFTADTDRWGASSTISNGYIYVAGGCISATDCTNATNSVQYAPISNTDGAIGTWAAGGNLPADRAWGSLEIAGGTLYYMGGVDDGGTNQTTVYYTSGIASGNPTWSGTAASNGIPSARSRFGSAVWNNRLYVVGGSGTGGTCSGSNVCDTVYVSPQLNSGGNITSAWSTTTAFNVDRTGLAVTAYANNLYVFAGYDGTNYLSDVQYAQIASNGTVGSWSYTRNLPTPLRDARAISANGYIYLVGGRTAATTCTPKVMIVPISANTTIASGNNPTGIGEWYETNVRYTGDRYGAAVAYANGKLYTMGGGCSAPLSADRHYQSALNSQPQVAQYSRMIDTDTDVFPTSWLINGLDNSIGARWQVRYRSMHDTNTTSDVAIVSGSPVLQQNPNEDCGTSATMPVMTTWGQDTNYGDVTMGDVAPYVARNSSGGNINCARYFYFYISIDASKTFGYPEDINRGPTISDVSLFFTSDPSKRLRHGKTFTGGEQQPLDTPCRQSNDADCPLP